MRAGDLLTRDGGLLTRADVLLTSPLGLLPVVIAKNTDLIQFQVHPKTTDHKIGAGSIHCAAEKTGHRIGTVPQDWI